jgi:sulfur carrier protein
MNVMVNGKEYKTETPISVSQLLTKKGYEKTLVSVEHNFTMIPKERWDDTMLDEGDNIEIIRFIGGG